MKLQIEHLEVISAFMENHTDFAKGELSVSNAKSKFKELWSNLAQRLNSSVEKWQKVSIKVFIRFVLRNYSKNDCYFPFQWYNYLFCRHGQIIKET